MTTSGYQDTNMVAQSIPAASHESTRLHYLDWLRVLAIFGVFLFHAVHPFDYNDWHIKNAEQSLAITILLGFFFLWGMPLFFLVAGAGSWFALRHRTARQYVVERVQRLLIPFIAGSILLTPIMLYFEWMHLVQRGVVQGAFLEYLANRGPPLSPDFFGWAGLHLWFLGFLFAFALVTLPLFHWLKGITGRHCVATLARLCEWRGGILLFILPLLVVQLSLRPFFPREHDWADFIVQMTFFVFGYLLFADERFMQTIRRDWWIILAVALVATVMATVMALSVEAVDLGVAPTTLWDFTLWSLITINGWCWTIFVLVAARRFLDFTNRWLQYGQEAVLPFFVLHQPVIIVIAFYVVQWNAGIPIKLLTVLLSSFVVSLGIYELIIRRMRVLRTLFGMKPNQEKRL